MLLLSGSSGGNGSGNNGGPWYRRVNGWTITLAVVGLLLCYRFATWGGAASGTLSVSNNGGAGAGQSPATAIAAIPPETTQLSEDQKRPRAISTPHTSPSSQTPEEERAAFDKLFGGDQPLANDPLLFVGIISCRTQTCARRRQFLREHSWPALVRTSYADDSTTFPASHWRRQVAYRFFVGREADAPIPSDHSTAGELRAEQATHHDLIVLLEADDSYRRLTEKTRNLVRWMDESDPLFRPDTSLCSDGVPFPPPLSPVSPDPRAENLKHAGWTPASDSASADDPLLDRIGRFGHYMKTDDDVYLNLPVLVPWLALQGQATRRIRWPLPRGRVYSTFWTNEVVRRGSQQWADDSFPTERYPPYPWGGGYIFNRDALFHLAAIARSPYSPSFVNEDATVGVWLNLTSSAVRWHSDGRFFVKAETAHGNGVAEDAIPLAAATTAAGDSDDSSSTPAPAAATGQLCFPHKFLWHHTSPPLDQPAARARLPALVERTHRTFTMHLAHCERLCGDCPPSDADAAVVP